MYSKFGYTVRHVPDFDNVPQELRPQPCFLLWKLLPPTEPGKKPRKVPFNIHGQAVSTKDTSQCCTLEEAQRVYSAGGFDGIGVNLEAAGIVGIDLDGLRELAEKHPWFRDWWAEVRASGAFVEFSPSGTGVHIYLRAALPFDGAKLGGFEVYKSGRYTTLTCQAAMPQRGLGELIGGEAAQELLNRFVAYVGFKQAVPKAPLATAPQTQTGIAPEVVDRIAAIVAEKHPAEWRGDYEDGPLGGGYGGDDSRGEAALARFIAQVAVAEGVQQEQGHAVLLAVLLKSATGQRDKWAGREQYLSGRLFGLVADEWQKPAAQGVSAGVPAVTQQSELQRRVAELDKKYFVALHGGDVRVFAREAENPLEAALKFDPFRRLQINNIVKVPQEDGRTKTVEVAEVWLRSPARKTYHAVVFDPSMSCGPDVVNLYSGLQIVPAEGDCTLILAHLRDCWAAGDVAVFEYLIRWLALLIQRPWQLPMVGIMVRGRQGTGKSTIAGIFLRAFGNAAFSTNQAGQVFGRFNGFLATKVFVVLEEAVFAADPNAENAAKVLITNQTLGVERKGIDAQTVRNFCHLLAFTNNDHAAPKTKDDRRWLTLHTPDRFANDHAYHAKLRACIEGGGDAAFIHYLRQIDLAGFNPAKMPETAEARRQRAETLFAKDSVGGWLLLCLQDGGFTTAIGFVEWAEQVGSATVCASYEAYARGVRHAASWPQAARKMRDFLPEGTVRTVRKREHGDLCNVLALPPLEVARSHFAQQQRVEF